MLEVKGVTKRYGKMLANDDISFAVKGGEIAVLLGPNGAGKSTLVKSIIGLLKYGGEITVDGHDAHSVEAKRLTGYIPEVARIYDALTVSEHIEFIRRLYGIDDDGYAKELMDRFEMWLNAGKLGKELSKGMRQKVSIMCGVLQRPKVVVFDEPIAGLDPHSIKELKKLFIELRESGEAVLISTHMIDSIEDFWDVAYIMNRGKIVSVKRNGDGGGTLEEMFFAATEGEKHE